MKISDVIEVERPMSAVWALFQNVPELAQCLPGAEVTADKGDGVYAGKVGVKLGPMSSNFEGEATVVSDPVAHTGTVKGKGVDKGGGSIGQVKVAYSLEESAGTTKVNFEADVTLSGAAAQFGRTGIINEMSKRLISEFVRCVEAKLSAETVEEAADISAPEVNGFSLFLSSLVASVTKLLKGLLARLKRS